ncbi:MAG: LysM peptidoglycan-binding domain-containing protein [Candidatus Promineifilaceae bacterium]|nr:LysM peptidoglycan-binding domain-containing protein [Candidatus Promineifilaceae bacterium]
MSEGEREEIQRMASQERGEVVKFAVLALILAMTVLVVAAARPLIFDQIVPAVLGWDGSAGEEEAAPTVAPTETPAAVEESATPVPPTPTSTPVPPTATPRIHVVQPGDNLTEIGERYGVSVDAILEANQMTNPHRIFPGQRLVIPDG